MFLAGIAWFKGTVHRKYKNSKLNFMCFKALTNFLVKIHNKVIEY